MTTRLATRFPDYGWHTNAGYGTAYHRTALARLGPTRHHRPSFASVAQGELALIIQESETAAIAD